MTKREAAIVTCYTGILIGDVSDFHAVAEELLGRPIQTIEFGNPDLWAHLKTMSKDAFMHLKVEAELDTTTKQLHALMKKASDMENQLHASSKTFEELFGKVERAAFEQDRRKMLAVSVEVRERTGCEYHGVDLREDVFTEIQRRRDFVQDRIDHRKRLYGDAYEGMLQADQFWIADEHYVKDVNKLFESLGEQWWKDGGK